MSGNGKPSKVEIIKENSRQLLGTLPEEIASAEDHISGDATQLLKHHGSYQQDNRDQRSGGDKAYCFMVRTRVPGGKMRAQDLLNEIDLGERYGDGTLRITTRQGLQLHGVVKKDLRSAIQAINATGLTTLAACGDVSRNTMCCPAPYENNAVHEQMQSLAAAIAEHLRPRTLAYREVWLKNKEGETVADVSDYQTVEEPIYGKVYLPRKFKIGLTLPEDNCIDVYTQDVGLIAQVEDNRIVGYEVLAGGSMGVTPAKKTTFPALAKHLCFAAPEQVVPVVEAIVKVQRDFGNRSDRRQARMKYLIHEWGIDAFRAKVAEYYGAELEPPRNIGVTGVDDHMGWHEQGNGLLFLGINVENGRIKDDDPVRMKSALRALLTEHPQPVRLTALQSLILCDIDPKNKSEIESILAEHGVPLAESVTETRRYSLACPALPTCGLAITESERVMPNLMDQIEGEMQRHGLGHERIVVHMTGCPNGCARPYTPDIGIVGKARDKYTVFLGGNAEGTRLAFVYDDLVPMEEIAGRLGPVFAQYQAERQNGESFGDFCFRVGKENLAAAPVGQS